MVFEDLLSVKVSSFSALHELVTIVLVPEFKMVKSVNQCFKLLFTLSDLAIKFVTIPLKLFLLLSGLNNIVGLRVLTRSLDFARARSVLLHKSFILDPQVLYTALSELKLDSYFVSLFFGSLELRKEDILMNLDFFLPLLH